MRTLKTIALAALLATSATIAYATDPTPVPAPEDTSERVISGPYTDVDGVTYVTPQTVRASLDWTADGSNMWCAIYSSASPTPTPGTCTSISALTSCGLCAAGAKKDQNCAANADCRSATDSTSTCTISTGKCLVTTVPYTEFRLTDRDTSKPEADLVSIWCWLDSATVTQCGRSVIPVRVIRSRTDVLHVP